MLEFPELGKEECLVEENGLRVHSMLPFAKEYLNGAET